VVVEVAVVAGGAVLADGSGQRFNVAKKSPDP
jgi:hypothetical protein